MTTTAKKLYFTAQEFDQLGSDGASWATYDFEGFELSTGEVMVPGESTNDCWYATRHDVQANGCATVIEITESEETRELSDAEIAESVSGSANEFGREAVPESLHRLIR